MKSKGYDYIILGAGIYGLYIARSLAIKYPSKKICIIEYDSKPFQRASFINQARIHNGYHYPRSLSTALKSAHYFNRFVNDYSFAINKTFEKIYAISSTFSYTSGENFKAFCTAAEIKCTQIHTSKYFKEGTVEEAFLTEEYSLDAQRICDFFVTEILNCGNVDIKFNSRINLVYKEKDYYNIKLNDEKVYSGFIINTTYASVNQILKIFGFEMFKIKYEIAEICLCNVTKNIIHSGITVMDGPFFSIMPFGLSGLHSLSAVHFTPHKTCYNFLPQFSCQNNNKECTEYSLENCNFCVAQPITAWNEMKQLAMKYLNSNIDMTYTSSLYAIKPILRASEISDSRPTIVKQFSESPTFISVLSGKFNTMYDLEEILNKQ
ncbi:MAG: FAD-dependent oxidoreductase [Candidatus Cloacimonetes bacterium]|nr:FAD-dependent oxidoreductase [Candidatus Cloacimonadota bacterium]